MRYALFVLAASDSAVRHDWMRGRAGRGRSHSSSFSFIEGSGLPSLPDEKSDQIQKNSNHQWKRRCPSWSPLACHAQNLFIYLFIYLRDADFGITRDNKHNKNTKPLVKK